MHTEDGDIISQIASMFGGKKRIDEVQEGLKLRLTQQVSIYACTYVCMHVYMEGLRSRLTQQVGIYACTYVCMYVHMCVCVYIYIYIYIYIHTHTDR